MEILLSRRLGRQKLEGVLQHGQNPIISFEVPPLVIGEMALYRSKISEQLEVETQSAGPVVTDLSTRSTGG